MVALNAVGTPNDNEASVVQEARTVHSRCGLSVRAHVARASKLNEKKYVNEREDVTEARRKWVYIEALRVEQSWHQAAFILI